MSLQKYIIGADAQQCPIILPFDESGKVGEWQRYGAGIMCKAEEVEARIALMQMAADWLHERADYAVTDLPPDLSRIICPK